jgi:hypothetical protein
MKTHRIYRTGCAALALIFILAACPGLTGPGTGSGETIPHGKGLARIRLGLGVPVQSVRTALPGISGYYFTLEFTAPGKTTVNETLYGSLSIAVPLEPGAWSLEVEAYADSSKAVLKAKGSTIVSITAGTESNFDVYLTPAFSSGGMGTLAYNISAPASVHRAWFGLYPIDVPESVMGTITSAAWETDISSSTARTGTIIDLPEGSYRAVIDLYDGANNQAVTWTGAVHIYNGSATSLTREFTAADFAGCGSLVGGTSLAAKLDAALGSSAGSYTIALDSETDLAAFTPQTLNVTGNKNITITIRGSGKTVQAASTGTPLFTLGADTGSTLTLAVQDLTLTGQSGNSVPVVRVNGGGTLLMKAGSHIAGNISSTYGGGVYVDDGGIFTMNGGAVSGNTSTAYSGGGVYVDDGGNFTINGGAVSDNTGNGVFVFDNGTFSMSGGAVSGNNVVGYGGGVYVDDEGTFSMSGGAVSGNTSTSYGGGGVYIDYHGTFRMSGGAVNGNIAPYGGGVNVDTGTFTMSGGVVSGNNLSGSGYGKEVLVSGTFNISGDARPERVFLYDYVRSITISDPLGGGTVPIDLGITVNDPLEDWIGEAVLKLDNLYAGDLSSLKTHFTLGDATLIILPYTTETENLAADYEIDNNGLFAHK